MHLNAQIFLGIQGPIEKRTKLYILDKTVINFSEVKRNLPFLDGKFTNMLKVTLDFPKGLRICYDWNGGNTIIC